MKRAVPFPQSLPTLVSSFIRYINTARSLLALGLLGPAALAAASLGTVQTFTITSTSWSTISACPTATVSLCAASCNAQPYTLGVDINYATDENTVATTATVTKSVVPVSIQASSTGFGSESGNNQGSVNSQVSNNGPANSQGLNDAPGTVTVIAGKTVTIYEPSTTILTAGAVYTTDVVYQSSVSCSAGDTVIVDHETIVVTEATTIYDCPCTKAQTLTVGGSYTTSVIYPDSMTCHGGETITISGTETIIPGPTVITNCPCTKPTTIYVPGRTTTLAGTTITGNAAASSTASVSGSGAMTSGASHSSTSSAGASGSSSAAASSNATSGNNP